MRCLREPLVGRDHRPQLLLRPGLQGDQYSPIRRAPSQHTQGHVLCRKHVGPHCVVPSLGPRHRRPAHRADAHAELRLHRHRRDVEGGLSSSERTAVTPPAFSMLAASALATSGLTLLHAPADLTARQQHRALPSRGGAQRRYHSKRRQARKGGRMTRVASAMRDGAFACHSSMSSSVLVAFSSLLLASLCNGSPLSSPLSSPRTMRPLHKEVLSVC